MTRTIRRKRRLIAAGAVLALIVLAAGVTYLIRDSARELREQEARQAGLEAHEAGDYTLALEQLSYYLRRNREDIEVLVAFADSRAKVFASNNRHLVTAAQIYNVVLEAEPDNRKALLGLLDLYERLGRQIEWVGVADRVLAQDPDNIEALRLKVFASYRDSDFDAAGDYLVRLMELEPENMNWRTLRLQLLQQQDVPLEELLAMCQQWIDEHSGDGRFDMLKARVLVSAGRFEEAQAVARDAAQRGADSVEILPLMLAMLDSLQLRREADELVLLTSERFPQAQWPREQAVRRLWQASRINDALDEIAVASEKHGSLDRGLLRWQSLLLMTSQEHEQAEEVLGRLIALAEANEGEVRDADRAWAAAIRARMNLAETDWKAIIEALQVALAVVPDDEVLHFLTGEAYLFLNEYELASLSFERASQIDPHWHVARLSFANALLASGKPREAWQQLLGMLQRGEGGLRSYILFARAWIAAGEVTDQIEGIIDSFTGQEMRLVSLLQRLHEAVPHDEVLEVLVQAALRYGQAPMATQLVEQTLQRDDAQVDLLVQLAHISMEYGLDLEEELIEAAMQRANGVTPAIAPVLARIHHRDGRTEQGIAVIDSAFADDADDQNRLRTRASFLCDVKHANAIDALRELLRQSDANGTNATFVLAQPLTWEHEELAESAIEQLAAVVGEESPRAVLSLGNFVLRFQSDRPEALARAQMQVNDLLQVVPTSLPARSLMAYLCMAGQPPDPDLAIRHLERAITSHPGQGDLYIRLIQLLQDQGNYTQAEAYLARFNAVAANQPALVHAQLQLLERQGDFDTLVARLSQTVDGASSESDRLMLLAGLQRAGRHEEAQRLIDELMAAPQRSDLTVRIAAEFFGNLGQFEKGLALLNEHAFDGGESAKHVTIGRYLQLNGRLEQARASFEQALERDANNVEALASLAALHGASGEHESAYHLAIRGLEISPSNESLQAMAVSASMTLGDAERARARALLTSAGPQSAALLDSIDLFSRALGSDGRLQPNRDHLEESRQLVQKHAESILIWRLAITLHVSADAREEAILLARQATVRLPHLAAPAQFAAELLADSSRYEEALALGQTWRQRSLQRPVEADIFIAKVYAALDRPVDAAQQLGPHLEWFLAERSRRPALLAFWLAVTLQADRADAALSHIQPLFDEGWRQGWIEAVAMIDEQPTARKALTALPADEFADPRDMLMLASAWSEFARRFDDAAGFSQAEELAKRAAQEDAELQMSSLLIRAQNADRQGVTQLAEALYRDALSIDSNSVVAMNNLADVLVREARNCHEAVELASRASSLAPQIPEIRDTQAHAQLCLDDPVEAERLAQSALEANPNSPDFLVTLGLAQATQGRIDEASSTLRRIEQLVGKRVAAPTGTLQSRIERLRSLLAHASSGV